MSYPKHLYKVIAAFSRLPGVGRKTAERYAFQMLSWNAKQKSELAEVVANMDSAILRCRDCGCYCDPAGCPYCVPERMSSGLLCVVAEAKDIFSIEATGTFQGIYHVLDGLLSPVDGIDETRLKLGGLLEKVEKAAVKEIVLALDATLEGDTTALFLKEKLAGKTVRISRLAFGIPMGSSFDYVDGSTLARALQARNVF